MNSDFDASTVKIVYLPTFDRQLKKLHDDPKVIKREFKSKLIKFIKENPQTNQFPNSGAGIGNVWKIRINGRGGYRIIYFAEPNHFTIICIYIYPKNKQANLTAEQKATIKQMTKQLKEAIEHEEK